MTILKSVSVLNPDGTKAVFNAMGNAAVILASSPSWYRRQQMFGVTKTSVVIPKGLQVNIGLEGFVLKSDVTLDLSSAGTAANRKGKDVYIYACKPSSGSEPVVVLSLSSTVPSGYTADTSRKIGGFHCLCANVGTISGHPLSGYVAGDILPRSVWDLMYRSRGTQAGMVLDYDNVWKGIYKASWNGSRLVSAYGAEIADGASSKKFNGEEFAFRVHQQGDRMMWREEFISCAIGSPEGVAIKGAADPGTTGGHVATNSQRIISNIGCEDCTGVMWEWVADTYENTPGSSINIAECPYWMVGYSWNDHSIFRSDVENVYRGSADGWLRRGIVGADWGFGAYCGSRAVVFNNFSSNPNSNIGVRLAADTHGFPLWDS